MKIYVLLHFEHKIDVTIITKLQRDACLQLNVPYKSLTIIVTSFYVQNVIQHRFSWNDCYLSDSVIPQFHLYIYFFSF